MLLSCRRLSRPVVRRRRQEGNCVVLVYVTLNTLEEGQRLAVNPSDVIVEGVKVNPKAAPEKAGKKQ